MHPYLKGKLVGKWCLLKVHGRRAAYPTAPATPREGKDTSGRASPGARNKPSNSRARLMNDILKETIFFDMGAIEVPADVIAEGLRIEPQSIHSLMQNGRLTSVCEKGINSDANRYRLTFFFKNRRFQLIIDSQGTILGRSTIDFGDKPLPSALRRPGV